MAVQSTVLDSHVNFAGAHGSGGSADSLDGFSGVFRIAANLHAFEISRSLAELFVISELYEAIVSPNQRTNALLLQLVAQHLANAAVDSLVDLLIGGEQEGNVKYVHSRDNLCPTANGVQTHIQSAGYDGIVHVFIFKGSAGSRNLDFYSVVCFSGNLGLQAIHIFNQPVGSRQLSS